MHARLCSDLSPTSASHFHVLFRMFFCIISCILPCLLSCATPDKIPIISGLSRLWQMSQLPPVAIPAEMQPIYDSCEHHGNSRNCNVLGVWYLQTRLQQKNRADRKLYLRHGVRVLDNACELLGNGRACANLAVLYRDGDRVVDFDPDPYQAQMYFRVLCNNNRGFACRELAFLYVTGEGVPQNEETALSFLKSGCRMGDAESCGWNQQQIRTWAEHRRKQRAATLEEQLQLRSRLPRQADP